MPLEWTANYETGESRLDRQHQRLFEYANELERHLDRFQAGEALDAEELKVWLSFLETHLYLHLTYEELLMRRTGHPAAERGRAAHKRLEAYGQGFRARLAAQGLSLPLLEELHHVMHTWLLGHVVRTDVSTPQLRKPAAQGTARLVQRQVSAATPLPRAS
ncbi:bacteriohemerythrin [Deinococcus piscis]|uniref:bacteriohemerythrin n=1 Tax=Deinococcus piscis TaxID=394230 RepID=UPI0016755D04|nr:hemerythrin domain-containing protein [Deinococcus piscis]